MKKWRVVLLVIVLITIFGFPDEINFFGMNWCIRNCEQQITLLYDEETEGKQQYIGMSDLLSIEDLKSRQEIYAPYEKVIVDFNIINEKNISCNFTVNWFHNQIRYHGWQNETNKTSPFYSWFNVTWSGKWKVQVVLEWDYFNRTYSKDSIVEFEVF